MHKNARAHFYPIPRPRLSQAVLPRRAALRPGQAALRPDRGPHRTQGTHPSHSGLSQGTTALYGIHFRALSGLSGLLGTSALRTDYYASTRVDYAAPRLRQPRQGYYREGANSPVEGAILGHSKPF